MLVDNIGNTMDLKINGVNGNIRIFRTAYNQRLLSFKGEGDSFSSEPQVIKGSIRKDELADILNTIKQNSFNNSGYTSNVFTLGDKIVKIPKERHFFDKFEEQQAKGQNLKEYYALSTIQNIDSSISAKPFGIIQDKDKYYLVEEFIKGFHPKGQKLTKGHISDLLNKFFKLDTNGIVNCDLQSGNIFLLDDSRTKLIDFGSFNFITNDGVIAGSDGAASDLFKTQVYQDTSKSASEKFLKTFLIDNYLDTKNLMDNPYLKMTSNASNFEFRTIYSHLIDGSEENPLEFFNEYLKQKAGIYHGKLKDFLKTLNFDKMKSSYPPDKIEAAQYSLKKAINYEDLINEVLSNPDDGIVKTELAKLQLRTFLNTGDSLGSPIENSKKLKAAYEQLISMLEDGINNSDGRKKEYFEETLKGFREKFKDFKFAAEQTEIPEKENLVRILFKKASEKQEEIQKPNIKETMKNKNNIGILIAIGIAVIAGIFMLLGKRDKKSTNMQNRINNFDNQNLTNNIKFKKLRKFDDSFSSQKQSDVFATFKK